MPVSIAPLLSVRRGSQAVDFYKAAFGAMEVFRIEDPGGAVVARLSVDGAEFWLSDESPEHANFSPETLGGGTARMVLTVPDPDAMFDRALAELLHLSTDELAVVRLRRPTGETSHHLQRSVLAPATNLGLHVKLKRHNMGRASTMP